jgi:hypothetical protein
MKVILFCNKCNKPNIYRKGMCQACYSKMYRNTDKGKEIMKAYNLSAGKEANRRYRERKKANQPSKPPKPPKQNCECGKPSVAKNLCKTCYQKVYIKNKPKQPKQPKLPKQNCECGKPSVAKKLCKTCYQKTYVIKKNIDISLYNSVLGFVKKGFTILNACKKAGLNNSSNLYKRITPLQKAELNYYKIIRDAEEEED